MNDEQKLEDLRKRLERENEILNATRNIRKIQESEAARATSDITIVETQQRIDYFQNEITKLLSKAADNSLGQKSASTNSGGSGQSLQPTGDRRPSTVSLHEGPLDSAESGRLLSTVGKCHHGVFTGLHNSPLSSLWAEAEGMRATMQHSHCKGNSP